VHIAVWRGTLFILNFKNGSEKEQNGNDGQVLR
jgi:hypothetical protein